LTPKMPAAVPYSESDSEILESARTPKFDSQGTQYDVTSFIDLMTPKEQSASTKLAGFTSDDAASATIVTLGRSNSAQYARPVYVGQNGVGGGSKGLTSKVKLTISGPVEQARKESSPRKFETPRRASFLQL